jgi:cystathionine beta-lyase
LRKPAGSTTSCLSELGCGSSAIESLTEFDNVDIDRLVARRTLKWGRHGREVIGAWVAEMDFDLAPAIRDALHDAIEYGAAGYPLRDISTGLPATCADWLATTFGWLVDAERIFLLPDVLTGIGLAIEYFGRPGSAVVIPAPAYPPFFEVATARRRRVIEVDLTTSGARHVLDIEAIDAALGEGAGTVLLCNPHNPVGAVFTMDELVELSKVVAARRALVIADEVHAPLIYPGYQHIPYASVSAEAAAHAITLTSASKGWNIAGLKCAQVVLTGEGDVARWRQIPFHARHGASTLGIVANLAAYTGGDPWRRNLVRYLDENRKFLARSLAAELPELKFRCPEATYLAWLDCRPLGLADPADHFRRHAKVALSDGAAFGSAGRGFVRLNFATSRSMLERIAAALIAAARER